MANLERGKQTIRANGAEFHYVAKGQGTPVVLVHGGLVDFRRWAAQIDPFSERHHVVAYSRRFNYPNKDHGPCSNYSAIVDADDLAEVIRQLDLDRCHIVAESYGAFAAMFLATRHPDLVRSLVLAEPPILAWLRDSAKGAQLLGHFMTSLWKPVGEAFRLGNRSRALEIIVSHFLPGMKFGNLPESFRETLLANLVEWEMLTSSDDPFPLIERRTVAGIELPVLLLSGEQTLEEHKIVDGELTLLIRGCARIIVSGSTHEMWDEQPDSCRDHALRFVDDH